MVAFGNYDFVKQNLFYTSTQFNGIAGYSLYWVLSLVDYFDYTGDRQTFDRLKENACNKLDIAYEHYGKSPDLQFFGWDERLGAGFENPNCPESQNAYKMLSLRAWNEFSRAAGAAGYADIAEKYAAYVEQKSRELREHPRSVRIVRPFRGVGCRERRLHHARRAAARGKTPSRTGSSAFPTLRSTNTSSFRRWPAWDGMPKR